MAAGTSVPPLPRVFPTPLWQQELPYHPCPESSPPHSLLASFGSLLGELLYDHFLPKDIVSLPSLNPHLLMG